VEIWRILYWSDWNAMLEAKMKLLRRQQWKRKY
jgi:hypothetical protein